MRKVDITGERFGRLIVISKVGSDGRNSIWECACACGNHIKVALPHLRQKGTRSCGCLLRETRRSNGLRSGIGQRSLKHGDFGSRLYGIWAAMKRRCFNDNTCYYKYYGGRGITVADEWLDYVNFKKWAISNGYAEGLSIDRIDVDKNYEPSNCRWVSMKTQQNNRRNNLRLRYKDCVYSVSELARITGLSERTIRGRLERGWTVEKTVETRLLKN